MEWRRRRRVGEVDSLWKERNGVEERESGVWEVKWTRKEERSGGFRVEEGGRVDEVGGIVCNGSL